MEIGEKIKTLRQEKKLTQKELAEKLNVSGQAISNWERGKGYPDISNIIQLSDLFNVSLDTLIKEDIDFKKNLLEEKAERRVNLVLSSIVFIIFLFILIWTLSRMFLTHFKEFSVMGLIVGILGVGHFGKEIYRCLKLKK
ncbi:helix-turn-helix domain-containing protein [Vagococcus sp.]|uniref:helix-turn-helix domain-containing protein n=1 Tax=Vagococcus sp. TaxID=1933889 RepID=UPI003F959CD9